MPLRDDQGDRPGVPAGPSPRTAGTRAARTGSRTGRATPCPRRSRPARVSSSTSRRTVTTETSSSAASTLTLTAPRDSTTDRIR